MSRSESLSDRKARLTPAQRRAFEQRLQAPRERDRHRITPKEWPGSQPASYAQEQLWLMHQLDPADASYHRHVALRIRGALDRPVLHEAISLVMRRHEVLRSRFERTQSGFSLRIDPPSSVSFDTIDLSQLAGKEQDNRMATTLTEEIARPFDLSSGPILRGLVVRLGEEDHVLLLVIHHIVFDAWSATILMQEIFTAYDRLIAGMEPELPSLAISYADYAQWQRDRYEEGMLNDQLDFWKKTLADAPPPVILPADRSRSLRPTCRGKTKYFKIPPDLVLSLRQLAQEERTTLFTIMLTAFMILVHRYTEATDIMIGIPVAGRDDVDTERLIGLFTNTIVVRGDLSGDPTAREAVDRMRAAVVDALDNRQIPLLKVVEAAQPERNTDSPPLFRALFNLENIPVQAASASALSVEPYPFDAPFVGFEWILELSQEGGELAAEWKYRQDLFEDETIRRATGHYETILRSMIEDVDQQISCLAMLSGEERHQILKEWNETQTDYPRDLCVHDLFEEQVVRSPDAPAVTFGDETLTYRELNRRANRVAHRLRRMGVGPDIPVGLCVERSNEMLIGILAILKAGGAYVPLDPALPLERLQFMTTDADLHFVLTQARLLPKLSPLSPELLAIDDAQPPANDADQQNPAPITSPDNLAYVIYTSGSTGSPKGVLINHRGVVSYFSWFSAVFELGRDSVVLQLASFAFDMSIRDLICPVTIGAHIILVSNAEVTDPFLLVKKIEKHRVTALGSTPSLLSSIVDAIERTGGDYRSLRRIFSGGEALPTDIARRILETFGGHVRLSNEYGPTECTMTSAHYEVTDIQPHRTIVPLGRPLANVRMYVLDRHLDAVPIGIPGEIHIGGPGLARGYLNRPQLTAERFIPDPFEPGNRLYKTGDLGHWLPSGDLEFLGRLDRQTKIRGFRIELGEVETALTSLPEVSQATADVFEPTPNDKRIVAYIIPATSEPLSPDTLKAKLRMWLPNYMTPSAFVILDRFPLTPRGKIDRSALPNPVSFSVDRGVEFVAPRTPAERLIARIWKDVLKIEEVSVYDDFFALGGHSLAAVQVIVRIRDETNADLSVRAVFELPTVREMAAHLEEVLELHDRRTVSNTHDVQSEPS